MVSVTASRRSSPSAARGSAALDRDEAGLSNLTDGLVQRGQSATPIPCDVALCEDVGRAFERVRATFGRVDILVNSAGVAHVGNLLATDEATMDRLYGVNVKGVYACSRYAVQSMLESGGGVILNLASIASLIGLEDRFAYSMTKGAVLSMTRSIAVDYVHQNIRCNCICPARIHTPFVDGFLAKNYPGREQESSRSSAATSRSVVWASRRRSPRSLSTSAPTSRPS